MSQGLHKMPVHWLPHYNEHLPEYSPGVLNGMAKHGVACQWYWGVCFREWIQGSGQGSNPIVDWMRCFRSFEPYPCIIELHQSPFMTLPDLRYHFLSSEYRYTGYTALHRFVCQRKERMKDPQGSILIYIVSMRKKVFMRFNTVYLEMVINRSYLPHLHSLCFYYLLSSFISSCALFPLLVFL